MKNDADGLLCAHDEKRARSETLMLCKKGSSKSTLNYTAGFYPCMKVADPEVHGGKRKKLLEMEKEERLVAVAAAAG